MTGPSRLILLPSIDIGKPEPSAWGASGSSEIEMLGQRARHSEQTDLLTNSATDSSAP
jgi:hypothetical protein